MLHNTCGEAGILESVVFFTVGCKDQTQVVRLVCQALLATESPRWSCCLFVWFLVWVSLSSDSCLTCCVTEAALNS